LPEKIKTMELLQDYLYGYKKEYIKYILIDKNLNQVLLSFQANPCPIFVYILCRVIQVQL